MQEHPESFDFCSIDVDFNTFWIWEALKDYRPRIICIEYNGFFAHDVDVVVRYDPIKAWDGTIGPNNSYFGASLLAFYKLARSRKYSLVYVENSGTNAYFVLDECVGDLDFLNINDVKALWKPLAWAGTDIWISSFFSNQPRIKSQLVKSQKKEIK